MDTRRIVPAMIFMAAAIALTGCFPAPSPTAQPSQNCAFALGIKGGVETQLSEFNRALNANNADAASEALDSIRAARTDLADFADTDAIQAVYFAARGSASGIERWIDAADRHLTGDPRITSQALLDETDTLRNTLATIDTACS